MMARWERWSLHLLTLGVSITGLLYFWMKYLLESDDPFSVLNHPWQAEALDLHLLLSPALVFVLGMVTRSHVSRKLEKNTRPARRSGLLTLFSFPVMVLSGYVPQVLTNRTLVDGLLWIHLGSGVLFFGTYALHYGVGLLIGIRTRGKAGASRRRSSAGRRGRPDRSNLFPLLNRVMGGKPGVKSE